MFSAVGFLLPIGIGDWAVEALGDTGVLSSFYEEKVKV